MREMKWSWPLWSQFWRYVEWVQFLMLNNAWISPSLKNFQGAQEWGVFGKIFTKFHKIFFCLRGLNAGAIIQKKFGFLDLPWKFRQNPCNRSRDMAVFRQGMFSKTSTFHLNSHISLANLAHKFLLLGAKNTLFHLSAPTGWVLSAQRFRSYDRLKLDWSTKRYP